MAPINTGNDFVQEAGLISAVDPILAALANLTARTMDMRRCIVTMTGAGVSYVIAESTRTLSLTYPHTHDPDDALMLGGGTATTSIAGLCEHTCSLLPPPPESGEPYLLEIPDLSRHPKFHDVGYVRSWPHGRFYCGAPLRTKNGVTIGTVCVLDDRTRYGGLTDKERLNMSNMADLFMQYLETKEGSRFRKKSQLMEMELSRFISEGFMPNEGSGIVERRNGRLWSENILQAKREQEEVRRKKVLERRQTLQEMEYTKMVAREREVQQSRNAVHERQSIGVPATEACGRGLTGFAPGPSQPKVGDSGTLLAPPEEYVPIVHPQQPGYIETVPKSVVEERASLLATVGKSLPLRSVPKRMPETLKRPETVENSVFFSDNQLSQEPESALPMMSQLSSVTSPTTVDVPDTDASSSVPVTVGGSTGLPESTATTSLQTQSSHTKRSKYEESMSMEPHIRTMFSRAATVIKNTLEADVVFVNGDLEGFFEPEHEDGQYPEKPAWPQVTQNEPARPKLRTRQPEPQRQHSGILGYATSTGSSAVRDDGPRKANLGFDISALRDANLRTLLQDCRGGKIISFFDQYPGLEEHEDPEEIEYRTILQAFLPNCRSVIIMPLHDHNHALSSVCFAWTCSDQKTFYGDDEGRFVAGIATALGEEMTRLQIISADKAKSDFISSISHELRSPLHGILASGEFLIDTELRMDQRAFVETIISCGTTLLDTVNHVLDFQKLNFLKDEHIRRMEAPPSPERELSSGTEDLTTSGATSSDSEASLFQARSVDTDFSAIVQEITEGVVLGYEFKDLGRLMGRSNTHTFEGTSKVSKLQVIADIDEFDGGWVFRSNPAALKRIVVNLVGNAIKYSNETGWIRISLSAKKLSPAANGAPRAKIALVVSDSGKGMAREFLKTKLFTPFTQENPMAPGAGLGLSIVRQLVDVLNGKIDVKSQLGKGTTIRIEMKATQSVKEDVPGSSMRECSTISSLSGKKALFVGFERPAAPETAQERGKSLLYESISRYARDLLQVDVIPDQESPGAEDCELIIVNELNALTQLHAFPKLNDLPVIVLSNNTPRRLALDNLHLDRSRHLFTFVRKPCGPKKLLRAARFCVGVLENGPPLKTPLPSAMEDGYCNGDQTPSYFPVAQDKGKGPQLSSHTEEKTEEPVKTSIQLPTPQHEIAMSPVISTAVPQTPQLKGSESISDSVSGAQSAEVKPSSRTPNILCVEDNKINMMLITTYMKKKKYPFKTACDGLQAVARVKEEAEQHNGGFDCILMDLRKCSPSPLKPMNFP